MSADFWAGYISGAAGIILGNPLDVLKVRLQAGLSATPPSAAAPVTPTPASSSYVRPFLLGTAAPVLGYGALNALLFVSYNRTEAFLNQLTGTTSDGQGRGTNLATTWLAGAVGGLATWVVSTPTELVKCRAQLQIPSSQALAHILRTTGLRGLYFGGTVTALRDSIGYGFYFWGYELCSRLTPSLSLFELESGDTTGGSARSDAVRVLLCGGLAGIITWASIFPLDVVKTRVQAQQLPLDQSGLSSDRAPLLGGGERASVAGTKTLGAWQVAKEAIRAFIVNAVQWAVYEWIMIELGQGREKQGVKDDLRAVAD
ncbi:mitochondrial carrier domain-containing protein [Thermothelomyces heterothallicus CBS 202.75]|uniref:mitochondrial carrier domain-containing protein n=1 Tax=Thermothelomyces heterothallicus CBS 202.75 TaxID=1149848 RepID=UPI003742044B